MVEFEKEGLLFEDKHFKVEMKRLEHGDSLHMDSV